MTEWGYGTVIRSTDGVYMVLCPTGKQSRLMHREWLVMPLDTRNGTADRWGDLNDNIRAFEEPGWQVLDRSRWESVKP